MLLLWHVLGLVTETFYWMKSAVLAMRNLWQIVFMLLGVTITVNRSRQLVLYAARQKVHQSSQLYTVCPSSNHNYAKLARKLIQRFDMEE